MNTSETLGKLAQNWRTWIFLISAALLIGLAFTYFSSIIIYLIIAFVISMIGKPVVHFLENKLCIPSTLSCLITMFAFASVFVGFVLLAIPLISTQINTFQQIDFSALSKDLAIVLNRFQDYLWTYGLMPKDHTLEQSLANGIQQIVGSIHFEAVFSNVVSALSNLFIGIFSVVFVTFFFLKDQSLFHNILLLFVPEQYEKQAENIIKNSQKLLSRYFVGLLTEIGSMMILLSLTMWALGVNNALLLGFMGGLLNIIPYLGPVIGATIASILAYMAALAGGFSPDLIWVVVKVLIAFSACNLFDNFVIQPIVYSKSVFAHPLEIFLVIMMAGSIAGVRGMIFAIPVYTLARIIAKEFFKHSKLVNKLTQRM
ncbi:MAG: AI-2E family transporter [Bacteroidales bacterium]|jgi:predicted PurR-regulated permease PerM|nr:AI-2E family transporter [Bacteroidales bacterium]